MLIWRIGVFPHSQGSPGHWWSCDWFTCTLRTRTSFMSNASLAPPRCPAGTYEVFEGSVKAFGLLAGAPRPAGPSRAASGPVSLPAPRAGLRCCRRRRRVALPPARPPRPRPSAMADVEDGDEPGAPHSLPGSAGSKAGAPDKMFSLKKWNAVAMWSWDVECDTCAICRVQVMGKRRPGRHGRGAGGLGRAWGRARRPGHGGRRAETRFPADGGGWSLPPPFPPPRLPGGGGEGGGPRGGRAAALQGPRECPPGRPGRAPCAPHAGPGPRRAAPWPAPAVQGRPRREGWGSSEGKSRKHLFTAGLNRMLMHAWGCCLWGGFC